MARQLRFFTSEVEKAGILVPPRLSSEQGGLQFDALEGTLAGLEAELLELNSNSSRLHRSYNELLELQVGVLAVGGAGGWVGWAGRRVGLPASSACPAMPCHDSNTIHCQFPRCPSCTATHAPLPRCVPRPLAACFVSLQLVLEGAGAFFEDARTSADRAQRESATAAYADSESRCCLLPLLPAWSA